MSLARRLARARTAQILVTITLLGGFLRFEQVTKKFGPDEHAPVDVYRYYVSPATSLLAGRGWVTDYKYNYIPPPGQAAFIALVKSSSPDANYHTVRYLQALLSTLAIPLAFWVGFRMGGPWVGLASAVLVAFNPSIIWHVSILLAESNYFFFLILFLATLLEACHRRSLRWSVASAGALAVSSLVKPFPMFLAVGIPLYLLARYRDRLSAIQGGVFILTFAILVSPWMIRNYLRYDHIYLISTNSGTLLAISNFIGLDAANEDQIYFDQIYRTDAWKDPDIEARFEGRKDRHGRAEWNEKDRAYFKHALAYIVANPLHFARNYAVKAYNVLYYPTGSSWPHRYLATLVLLGLAGLAWFIWAERAAPRWVMVVVCAYFLGFAALMHIEESGRTNAALKIVLGFFAAYLVGRCARHAWSRWVRRAPTRADSISAGTGPGKRILRSRASTPGGRSARGRSDDEGDSACAARIVAEWKAQLSSARFS
jgi:4-amino-4-deoxy-L-arabinose transferase-like glycosyltransferase